MKLTKEEIKERYCHDFEEGKCIYCGCSADEYFKDSKENSDAHGE